MEETEEIIGIIPQTENKSISQKDITPQKESKSFFSFLFNKISQNQKQPIEPNSPDIDDDINADKTLWIPDDQAESCFKCGIKFMSLLNRRHHCRICGNVFCKDCTTKIQEISIGEQKRELKTCEYCRKMYEDLSSLYEISLNEYRDNQGNKTFETKLSDYVKSKERTFNDIQSFIRYNDSEEVNNILYDKKLEEHYLIFARAAIKKVLQSSKKYPNLYDDWGELLTKLTIKAIDSVSPSFQDLGDSININEFIKIKGILYHDQSLSRVIDGYAFQKNVCTKKMKTIIDNPKILILNCGLDAKRDDKIQMPNILTVEPAYLQILKKKIESVKPQVILISKSASHKFQEDFSTKDLNISLVTNVKEKSLHKIARCTKTLVLPSADLIGKQIILGQCEKFKVEKIRSNIQNDESKGKLFFMSNEYNLMVFEGCGQMLHCTILLSGKDKDELRELKQLMKNSILLTVRDLYLQKYLLKYFNVDIFQTVDSQSENNNINNNNKNNNSLNDFSYGFDTQILHNQQDDESKITLELIQLFMNNGKSNSVYDNSSSNISFSIPQSTRTTISVGGDLLSPGNPLAPISLKELPTKESEILKSVSTFCEKPQNVTVRFYSSDIKLEKPLGKLIIDLCVQKDERCPSCNEPFSNHSYYLYQGDGRIKISMLKQNEDYLDDIIGYLSWDSINQNNIANKDQLDIYSYGYCEIDGLVVTPLIKLPKEIFNFSASRFYKHFLFNHSIKNFIRKGNYNIKEKFPNDCDHFLYKNISRIFITKIGSIKFTYEPTIKYEFVDSKVNMASKEVLDLLNQKTLESVLIITENITREVLIKIKQRFQEQMNEISKLNNILLKDCIEGVKEVIKVCSDIIDEIIKILDFFKAENFENALKANVSIKSLYLKIVQAKVMSNMIAQVIRKINIVIFIYEVWEKYNEFKQPKIQQQQNEEEKDTNEKNEQSSLYINQANQPDLLSTQEKDKSDIKNASTSKTTQNSININQSNQKDILLEKHIDKIIEEQLKIKKERDEYLLEEIYKLDKDENYNRILDFLSFYDHSHTIYSVDVDQNDFCSLIAHLLTSDQYLSFISSTNNIHLNEINRKILEMPCNADNDLFKTSLLFSLESINYSCNQVDKDKVRQHLETELLSDEKTLFNFSFNFNLTKVVNDAFTDIKGKTESSSNSSLKINYSDVLYKFHQSKEKLEKISSDIKIIKNSKFGEIKSKFNFIKLQFIEDAQAPLEGAIIAYYPKQFEAMRILYCTSYEDFVLSIGKSLQWKNVSGGKSKADFYKSLDNKYVIKCIGKQEFKMFIESGFHYFHHTNKYIFHKMPSAMAKTVGAFKVKFKYPEKKKFFCVIIENLYYNVITKTSLYEVYDLKGSKVNRYIKKQDQKVGRVLQDTNFMEKFKGSPLVLDKHLYTLFKSAIQNDCLILNKMTVIDYSLLLIITETQANLFNVNEGKGDDTQGNENKNIRYIKMGIIDYFRKYTWDKQMEMIGKKLILKDQPTIINPINYKKRFINKITNYFIGI